MSAQPWRRHLLDLISCTHNHRVPEQEPKHKCERPEQKNFGRVWGLPGWRGQPSTWGRGDGRGLGWLVSGGCWETPHIRQKCPRLESWPSRLQPALDPGRRFLAQGGGGIEADTPQTVMGRVFPRLRAGFQKQPGGRRPREGRRGRELRLRPLACRGKLWLCCSEGGWALMS